jgi:hypothetical protein
MKTLTVSIYTCGCGYETTNPGNASKHKKVECGNEMEVSPVRMVRETDYLEALAKASGSAATVEGDNNVIDQSTHNHITNINLVLPEHTTKEDFVRYLETLNGIGYRSDPRIMEMPGRLLMTIRGPEVTPGALIERKNKIVEKLPDGSERVMPKNKAVKVYTSEAIDALCQRSPDPSVDTFLEKYRGSKRVKMSVSDAAKLRLTNPSKYHIGVPDAAKTVIQKMEQHTGDYLDKITTANKDNGFL